MVTPLGWVGNSLTYQDGAGVAAIMTKLGTIGYDSTTAKVDGLIGRSIVNGVPPYIPSSQTVIQSYRDSGFSPHFWLIELCSNDYADSSSGFILNCNTLLAKIKEVSGVHRVLWVGPITQAGSTYDSGVYPAQSTMMRNNLTALAAAPPTNIEMRYLDIWTMIDRTDPTLWKAAGTSGADGRHMSVSGYALRNTIINDFVYNNSPDRDIVGSTTKSFSVTVNPAPPTGITRTFSVTVTPSTPTLPFSVTVTPGGPTKPFTVTVQPPSPTKTFAVTVLSSLVSTHPFVVTVFAPAHYSTLGFSVTETPDSSLVVTPNKTHIFARETVTLIASGSASGGTLTWSSDQGTTLAGTGLTRTLLAPRFVDDTTVTVTVNNGSTTVSCSFVVEGTPSFHSSDGWHTTSLHRA